jgi:hypothetical protein
MLYHHKALFYKQAKSTQLLKCTIGGFACTCRELRNLLLIFSK